MPPPPDDPAPALPPAPAEMRSMPPVPIAEPATPIEPPGAGPKGLPAVDWTFWQAILVGIVTNLVFAQVIVGVILLLALGIENADDPKVVYVGLVGDLAWLGLMVAWLATRHPGWQARIGILWRRWIDAVVGYAVGLGAYFAISILVALPLTWLFRDIFNRDVTTPDQLPSSGTTVETVVTVILVVLIAPIAEELFFRGILFRSLRDRRGFWLAAVVSALIFGAVHGGVAPGPWQNTLLLQSIMFFTGLTLAGIYEWRGNLLANIAAHAAFNTVGIIAILASR